MYPADRTARSGKVDVVKATYSSYGDQLEVVAIEDVISGDFTAALQGICHNSSFHLKRSNSSIPLGVTAVIHLASPITGRADNQTVLDSAVQGTKNVLEQAIEAGIKRLVITSSHTALFNPKKGEKLYPGLYNDQGMLASPEYG